MPIAGGLLTTGLFILNNCVCTMYFLGQSMVMITKAECRQILELNTSSEASETLELLHSAKQTREVYGFVTTRESSK